jgi:hypothetical protein
MATESAARGAAGCIEKRGAEASRSESGATLPSPPRVVREWPQARTLLAGLGAFTETGMVMEFYQGRPPEPEELEAIGGGRARQKHVPPGNRLSSSTPSKRSIQKCAGSSSATGRI